MKNKRYPELVAVAMSGGVDSSTAAALLLEEGFSIVGFSMQLWDRRRSSGEEASSRCCSLDDIYDARAVAARLGFPYYVVNLEDEFERRVVSQFIDSYCRGLTPSPCVLCNSHLKFDRLLDLANGAGAVRVATGHYARVEKDTSTGRYSLLRGRDRTKDQSYFLFELRQEQLARAMFPLGELTKLEVREIARCHGLQVAEKAESQEICFVPDGDYAAFIERHYADLGRNGSTLEQFRPGEIVTTGGEILGKHPGIHHFTVGQRRGLGIAHSEPLYVLEIKPDLARIVVGERSKLGQRTCRVVNPNWIAVNTLTQPMQVHAKIRSRHTEAPALITPSGDETLIVEFETPQAGIAPGQACVFYSGESVIGGGWIARAEAR